MGCRAHMRDWSIGRTAASQAAKAGSTPVFRSSPPFRHGGGLLLILPTPRGAEATGCAAEQTAAVDRHPQKMPLPGGGRTGADRINDHAS